MSSPPLRIFVGGLRYESNSFVRQDQVDLTSIRVGSDVVERPEPGTEVAGAVARASQSDRVDLVGGIDGFLGCGGPPRLEDLRGLIDELLTRLDQAGPVDAVYLPLHGAFACDEESDVDGHLAAVVRKTIGDRTPLVVSLDLHAAVSDELVGAVDAIVGFKTCPHVDYEETGQRAMSIAISAAAGEISPAVVKKRVPILTAAEVHDTTEGPMVRHAALAHQLESPRDLLDLSVFAAQPWLDAERTSWSVTATVDASRPSAEKLGTDAAARVCESILDDAASLTVVKHGVEDVLDLAAALPADTVLIADSGDSPSAGAGGDSTHLLRQLLHDGRRSLATVTDPSAAAELARHGAGSAIDAIAVGGSVSPDLNSSLELRDVSIVSVHDGLFRREYPAAAVDAGVCVVVTSAQLTVVVTSRPAFMLDLSLLHHVGVDPGDFRFVQVKSAGGFRARWGELFDAAVVADSLGASTSRLDRLPFRRLARDVRLLGSTSSQQHSEHEGKDS